jgi:hypothetical protein
LSIDLVFSLTFQFSLCFTFSMFFFPFKFVSLWLVYYFFPKLVLATIFKIETWIYFQTRVKSDNITQLQKSKNIKVKHKTWSLKTSLQYIHLKINVTSHVN